jgi:hypothetical protein
LAPAGFSTGIRAAPPLVVGALPRLWLPDLSAMLAVVTLAYCLFVFGAGTQLFRDADSGWHIRNGEWILDHHALPGTDPYSFSKAGQPWVQWEWGTDVLMGLAHRLDGLRGVTAFFALALALCIWMCCRLHFAAGGDFFLTALLAPLIVTTTSLHWLARPHVISWLFLLGAVLYCERAPARFDRRQLIAVAAVSAVWANLHGSFIIGPVIALLYAKGHLLRRLFWPLDAVVEKERTRGFLRVALASLAGSLLNPYGWRLHAHVISYLRDEALTSRVAEFQSFNFHDKDAHQVALTLALAMAGGLLALSQKQVGRFLVISLLAWEGLVSARVLPLVALLGLPLANASFATAWRDARHLRSSLQRKIDAVLRYSDRLRQFDRQVRGTAFCAVAVPFLLLALRAPAFSSRIGFPPDRFPVKAAAEVAKLPAGARLLAPDSFGGYLIYRFDGARKVFFDGRSDFYGAAFMKQYLVLVNARPGWQEIARAYRFTHALVPSDAALKAALEQAGWTTIYKDDVAVLLEAR